MYQKHFLKFSAAVTAVLLSLSACTGAGGEITAEDGYISRTEFTSLSDEGITSSDGLYCFSVEASNASGDVLTVDFYADVSFIATGGFSYSETPVRNSCSNARLNGLALTGGSINAVKNEDNYTFTGMMFLPDGSLYSFQAKGMIHYDVIVDPEHGVFYEGMDNDSYGGKAWSISVYDLENHQEATLFVCNATGSSSPIGTYEVVWIQNIVPGTAMMGVDYSSMGIGKLGCYFIQNGEEYYIKAGAIEIKEEMGMLSIEATGLTVMKGDAEETDINSWSALYCQILEEKPVSDEPDTPDTPSLPDEMASYGCYYAISAGTPDEEAGTTDYTIQFYTINKEDYSKGDALGQFVFSVPSDMDMTDPTGTYTAVKGGMYLAQYNYYYGTYVVYQGKEYFLNSAESLVINIGEDYTSTYFELVKPQLRDADGNVGTISKAGYYYTLPYNQ